MSEIRSFWRALCVVVIVVAVALAVPGYGSAAAPDGGDDGVSATDAATTQPMSNSAFADRTAAADSGARMSTAVGDSGLLKRALAEPTAVDPDAVDPLAASVAPAAAGGWQAVDARRIADTRSGSGGPIAAGGTRSIKVTGAGGLPAGGIGTVGLTLTVPDPAQAGTLAVYARGATRPTAPAVTFSARHGVSTLVFTAVDAAGYITVANNSTGPIQLIVDTAGYGASGAPAGPGSWVPVTPARVVDTATGIGATGRIAAQRAVVPRVLGKTGIPATGVVAVTMIVTVTSPTQDGYLTVRPEGQIPAGTAPPGSNINFASTLSSGNLVIVPVSGTGGVQLYNNSWGSIGLTADITGYITAGTPVVGSLVPLPMTRLVDTRFALGLWPYATPGPIGAHTVNTIKATGSAGIPIGGAGALLLSVTVNQPTVTGFLRVHRDIYDGMRTANVNFVRGKNATNLVLVPITGNGTIQITNPTDGTANVIIDVVGYIRGVTPEPPMVWSAATATGPELAGASLLDCTAATFCLALTNSGGSARYGGTTWQSVGETGLTGVLTGLSCASATFCMAISTDGAGSVFNGSTWRATAGFAAPTDGLSGVSCVSSTFCMAVTSVGTSYRWNGTGWAAGARVTATPGEYEPIPVAVACGSTTSCTSVGTSGGVWTFNGTGWTVRDAGVYEGSAVDCPTASFCAILDSNSYAVTGSGSSWVSNSASWSYLTSLSCADATFCVAVGGTEVTDWDGTEWNDPAYPSSLSDWVTTVSCPTHQFCMALGDGLQIVGTR